jgi:hypothetical protein
VPGLPGCCMPFMAKIESLLPGTSSARERHDLRTGPDCLHSSRRRP